MSGFRPLLHLFILLFLAHCAVAQPGSIPSSLKKKDQKRLTEARDALSTADMVRARSSLNQLIDGYPQNQELYFLRSEALRALGEYAAAEKDIQTGITYAAKVPSVAYRKLAEVAALSGNFSGAVVAYRQYRDALTGSARPERQQEAARLLAKAEAAAALAANPVPYIPNRLSDSINTDAHLEYFPTLSLDGERLIFTRRVNGENEDFYFSERNANGEWTSARPLEGINTEFDEGAQTISGDGQYLVYTVCNRPEGAGSCDLYYSVWSGASWSRARSLGPKINTRFYEAQPSISPDGRLLFFSSNREGGEGGSDLYASARLTDGSWSVPRNLGPNINSPGKESYPFWSADGQTLFFTSNGHPGLGGEDLFRVVLDANNVWGVPENLGYPINTSADETNLFVARNGTRAYFSKREVDAGTGRSDVDIFEFELPPTLRPKPTTYVEATVTDAVSGVPLSATVRLRPLAQDAPPAVRRSNPRGYFLATLPAGKDYALTVNLEGYVFYSDRFSLSEGFTQEEPYQLNIRLQPLLEAVATGGEEADGSTAFRNVLFATGSAELLPVSGDELDRLAELLRKAPGYHVEISGHTDDVGGDVNNLALSRQRAASVKSYLVAQGVAADRVSTQGFGEARPVAPNDTEEGRARNRRTTFKLLDK